MNKKLEKFCNYLGAYAEPSTRKFFRIEPMNAQLFEKSDIDFETKTVGGVAIHIPEDRVNDFFSMLDEQKYQEMTVRNEVPAVKKAYEHYQLLLKMCGVDSARY